RLGEVVVVEVDVEQVDGPGQLAVFVYQAPHDLAGDRQGRGLRGGKDIPVVGGEELCVLLVEQALEQVLGERVASGDAGLRVVGGKRRLLVQPLPEDADADLAGRHVLHQ